MKEHSCAILGSSPLSFPWGFDEEDDRCVALKLTLFNKITHLQNQGITDFYVVMDAGTGLYAAEIINGLREDGGNLHLVCVIPWEEQATKWTPELRDRYFNTLEKCDDVQMISKVYSPECEIKAMLNAIDAAGQVLTIRGEDTGLLSVALHYAQRVGRQVTVLR